MTTTVYIAGTTINGSYQLPDNEKTSKQYSECELAYIEFYDDNNNVVTPITGEVLCQFSPEGSIWRNSKEGTLQATTVYDATTVMPYVKGMVHDIRVNLTSITGATSFRACFWRR